MRPHSVKFSVGLFGVAFLAFLAGCGGGGSGGSGGGGGGDLVAQWVKGGCSETSTPGSITYRSIWGSAPANASQVVQVITSTGQVVRTESFNRAGGDLNATLTGIAPGVYELRARMFSLADAGGTEVGVATATVDLCTMGGTPTATITTRFGASPASMKVFPDLVSVGANNTIRFLTNIAAAGGGEHFAQPDGVTWQALGGVGSVDVDGNFTATKAGTGTVRATLDGSALLASASVQVTPFNPTRSKWTVLVYLNAANDLFAASDLNMNQMERVAGNPQVRFVVQWKQSKANFPSSSFDGVRRYLVKPDNSDSIQSELVQANLTESNGSALDMGKASNMADFIKWGKTNYPADRYVLVIWNHGNGWRRSADDGPLDRGVSYDDQYGTSIKTWETDAMMGGETVDVLSWDASLMQMLEVAYEARDSADYIVGSEESPPAEGLPYDTVFKKFRDNPDQATSELCKAFVDGMVSHPPYATRKITQSVLDTSKLQALATATSDLGVALLANKDTMPLAIQAARVNAQTYSQTSVRYFRDLWDVCEELEAHATTPDAVKQKCVAVRAAITQAVIYEGHNANSAGSRGISIDFSPGGTFAGSTASDYVQMKFGALQWDEFLKVAP